MNAPEKSGITEGIQDVIHNLGAVVQNETRLAKAEAIAGMKEVVGGLTTMGIGLAFVIPALTLLGTAASNLLASQTELSPWISFGIIGVAFALIGGILIQVGRKTAASDHVAMATTTDNLKEDLQALKESVQ